MAASETPRHVKLRAQARVRLCPARSGRDWGPGPSLFCLCAWASGPGSRRSTSWGCRAWGPEPLPPGTGLAGGGGGRSVCAVVQWGGSGRTSCTQGPAEAWASSSLVDAALRAPLGRRTGQRGGHLLALWDSGARPRVRRRAAQVAGRVCRLRFPRVPTGFLQVRPGSRPFGRLKHSGLLCADLACVLLCGIGQTRRKEGVRGTLGSGWR